MLDFLLIYSKSNMPLHLDNLEPFINERINDCSFDYGQSYYFFSKRKDRFALFCSSAMESHLARKNGDVNFFDGIIFQDDYDEACIDIRTLKPILDKDAADHSEVFGNYCCGLFSENGMNHVHGNILGQYPLFIGFSAECTVLSNNPHLAAHALHGKEYKDHKNVKALGWILSTLSIKDLSTAYGDVYFFPQNAGAIIGDDNFVSFYSLCNNLYYPMELDEWNQIFETTHSKLLKFLPVYCSKGLKHGIGAEITGGIDSRVTLALAIQAGIHKNVEWTVQGYEKHPDVVIAKSIAQEFDLPLQWQPPKEFSQDEIESSFDASLIDLHKTAGMTQYSEVWSLSQDYKPFMVTGAAGEMFRGYRSMHLAEKGYGNTLLEKKDREFLFDEEFVLPRDCFNPGTLEYYHDSLMGVFGSFEELYSYDLVLCRTRMPQFHGGLYLRYLSPYICCIGHNSWLHRLSMIEAPELRASDDIPFRLIENSAPGLLNFPLDKAKWPYLAYAHSKYAKKISALKIPKRKVMGKTSIYFTEQLKLLFRSHDIKIHDSLYQVFTEKYIERLMADSGRMINGNKAIDVNILARAIDILGISAFMDNRERSPANASPKSISGNLSPKNTLDFSDRYTPPYIIYKEPAKQVIGNLELCFQRNKVFHREDHNMLGAEEQKKFAPQVKKSTMTFKGAEAVHGTAMGFDPVKELLELAPQVDNVSFRQIEKNHISRPDNSFDVVWCCLVLGGIRGSALSKCINEICRVLRPDGLLFLVENTAEKVNTPSSSWIFRTVREYQSLFPSVNLVHLHDYYDADERISILAGRINKDQYPCKSGPKSFIRALLPQKSIFLYHVIRDGRLNEYISGIRQYKKDKNLAPSAFPLYLSVAAIVKNETPYIAEWIEYHLLVGVQKFFIYDNESTDNLKDFLEPYIDRGIVEYTFFPGKRRQVFAYNDALQRHKHASFWLAFIDIDEFLVPVEAETISSFLRDFEDAPGIEINQVLYGSSGHKKKTSSLVMERFKDHSWYDLYDNRGVKSIVNPRHVCYMATAHVAEYFDGKRSVDTNKNKNTKGSLDRPALHDKLRRNHYACKSLEEFTSRIDLGRASSPGKLSIEEFYSRDHNEIKNDPIMDKYIQKIKQNINISLYSRKMKD
jgi:SAM-dependent methyltransferase